MERGCKPNHSQAQRIFHSTNLTWSLYNITYFSDGWLNFKYFPFPFRSISTIHDFYELGVQNPRPDWGENACGPQGRVWASPQPSGQNRSFGALAFVLVENLTSHKVKRSQQAPKRNNLPCSSWCESHRGLCPADLDTRHHTIFGVHSAQQAQGGARVCTDRSWKNHSLWGLAGMLGFNHVSNQGVERLSTPKNWLEHGTIRYWGPYRVNCSLVSGHPNWRLIERTQLCLLTTWFLTCSSFPHFHFYWFYHLKFDLIN